jgi:hypothetical protein
MAIPAALDFLIIGAAFSELADGLARFYGNWLFWLSKSAPFWFDAALSVVVPSSYASSTLSETNEIPPREGRCMPLIFMM